MRGMRARRGDLSGPVLAILLTIIILSVGVAIIAYLTLFARGTTTPVAVIQGQPTAYRYLDTPYTRFEMTIVNLGNAPLKIETGPGPAELRVQLTIVYPEGYSNIFIYPDQTNPSTIVIYPGGSAILTFTPAEPPWDVVKQYETVHGILRIIDSKGDVASIFEIGIKVIGGGA
ncbi:MAG: hypothetical protein P3X22_003720 [Thermoprotei archaeon]|nr:hypothetical protein [Thermoprotei archaeon]